MNKKGMVIVAVVIVLLVAGGVGYRVWASNQSATTANVQTASVTTGSLQSTLGSSGNTRSGQSATINWQTSGKVGEVTLKPGDTVKANDVLAALDPNSLPSDMIQAKLDLIDAQQALDDLVNSKTAQAQALQAVVDAQNALDSLNQTSAEDASQAQLALANAQTALQDAEKTRAAMNYPHTTNDLTIQKAQTDYELAKQAYKDALQAFNKVAKKKLTNPDRVMALNNLVTAEQNMNTKLGIYNWYLLGYTPDEIAQADAEVAVAQANLDKAQSDYNNLKNGTSAASLDLAQAQLEDAQRAYDRVKDGPNPEDIAAAQAKVDAAQATLDHAQLLAPFAGTITEVDVSTGDLVNQGDTAFRIDDLSSIYIDLQISEVDLASVKVGQQVTIQFDAIANKTYNGQVTAIGMVGNVSQGVVNYDVTVKVTDPDQNIRPGMTASVTIILDQRDNVLLVPNRAIHTSNGQKTVTVLFEGQQITVPITIGLVGDSQSEVSGGQLREGDVVVISSSTTSTTSSGSQTRQNFGGGFEFGGGPGGVP